MLISFWLAAAAILAATLILLLKPLWSLRADKALTPARNDSASRSGHQRLWPWIGFVALTVTVSSIFFYTRSPDYQLMQRWHGASQAAEELIIRIDGLQRRLEREGGRQEQWLELAAMQTMMRRPQQALASYRSAERLAPIEDAEALIDFGAALLAVGASEQDLREALALLERVLLKIPKQNMALWYAGEARFKLADFSGAADYWQLMLDNLRGDSQELRAIRAEVSRRLERARAHASMDTAKPEAISGDGRDRADGTKSMDASKREAISGADAEAGPSFTVRVSLDAALRDRLSADDVLFVYARAAQGPPMPLAIKRLRAADMPLTAQLSNRDAMMPSMNLNAFPEVEIVARISMSGQAAPQAGDLIAVSAPQAVMAKNQSLELLINTVYQP